MTSKEQELKALEQIRKIIEGLGENSYIGTAMDGMIEDAEENIKNDFALSWKDRAQTAEKACDLRRDEAYKLREANEKISEELKLAKQTMIQESDRANAGWNRARELNVQFIELSSEIEKHIKESREKDMEILNLKNEIINLKAKLYDLIEK